MALSNYTELQAAVRTELGIDTGGISDAAIVDAITRAEAKINRKARLREQEQLSYTTYAAATESLSDRLVALPDGMVELIHLWAKPASSADSAYEEVGYVSPGRIWEFYGNGNVLKYALRDQLEMSRSVGSDHTLMMHYLKKWDIATDSTNWLLTNYPDAYLYGALAECSMHVMNDERIPLWKALFEQAIAELNELDERGRDDSEADTSELVRVTGGSRFNILTG